MGRLDQVIVELVETYKNHTSSEGEVKKMTLAELNDILEKEITRPKLKEVITREKIEEATKVLDNEGDGDIKFRQFCRCVMLLAKDYYLSDAAKGGKKKGKEGKN